MNRISVARQDKLCHNQMKTDFPERSQDDHPGWSREDCLFIKFVQNSVRVVDGHYSIGLPQRRSDLSMLNKKLAE